VPAATPNAFERYRPWRRTVEVAFWVAVFLLQAAFNSLTVVDDMGRAGLRTSPWQPVVWEFSSNLVLLALVPALVAFERRFPVRLDTLARHLPLHLAGSVAYSMAHVASMVLLRQAAYAAMGAQYEFGDWPVRWFYEYLKDVRTYFLLLGVIVAYRFILLRLQGEASLLAAPEEGPPVEPVERPQRFLVRKLRKEFLVGAADIEWLHAEGNYVALRVRGHDYLLRSTMAALEARLDPARFARVHRGYIVNLDQVAEIEPLEDGDARVRMRDGGVVPCSRTYRHALRPGASA
jgi:hypothetical protein